MRTPASTVQDLRPVLVRSAFRAGPPDRGGSSK